MGEKLAAVSIDLDEIACYAQIHGLSTAGLCGLDAVYARGLDRLTQLLSELGIRATFFAIGADLACAENARRLRRVSAEGHEIGNHTLSHRYDLTRLSRACQQREIVGGADAIAEAVGTRPLGFRAPGYTLSDAVIDILEQNGFLYDSSLFPCPAYYAAKAVSIGLIALRGRRSHSIVDAPQIPFAPADPFRTGVPYHKPGRGIVELPIGVTSDGSGRLPYIGTSVVSFGTTVARVLTALVSERSFVNLELHGIDLCDAEDDGLTWLRPYQPDLRKRASEKRAALRAALEQLRRRGYRFVTLAEAARLYGRQA